jgi:hypothetical protein
MWRHHLNTAEFTDPIAGRSRYHQTSERMQFIASLSLRRKLTALTAVQADLDRGSQG